MVFDGFGTNFDDFWWPGAGLKHHDFRWFSGGGPRLRTHGRMMVFGLLSGPHSIFQTVSRSNSTCKIHHETCRNERIRKSRMQNTKIRKIKAVTCSHYNRGSRIQDRAGSLAAGHPRGRRMTGSAFQRWTLLIPLFFFNRRGSGGGWGGIGPGAEAGGSIFRSKTELPCG